MYVYISSSKLSSWPFLIMMADLLISTCQANVVSIIHLPKQGEVGNFVALVNKVQNESF